ncbi:MAG: hypothetical protein ACJAVZ_002679 [Afipia broomeae]|jgi:hypothetical protein
MQQLNIAPRRFELKLSKRRHNDSDVTTLIVCKTRIRLVPLQNLAPSARLYIAGDRDVSADEL